MVILLGFNMEFEDFMENARVMLPDVHAKLYKRPLQAPHVTCLGWLLGSHDDLALSPLETLLQEVILKSASSPIPSPKLALTYKPIWDGTKKSDRAKDKKIGRQGIWAAHVVVETLQAPILRSLLKRALKSSAVKAYTNLPLLLVPLLTPKTLFREAEDIHFARSQQQVAQNSMSKHFSSKIRALDRVLASLDNATLRTTLMAVKAFDGKNMFLSVDPCWNGQGYTVTFPAKYCDFAQEFVEYMPKYLQHAHGDAVFRWFQPEAVVEANNMDWDDVAQRPITQDGVNFKHDLLLLDFEWCTAKPGASTTTAPVDMDNLSLTSFQTISEATTLVHPAGPSTTAPPSALPRPNPCHDSDDLTTATGSTINSRLSALETGWQTILHKLDQLMAPGALRPSTASGSTSAPSLPSDLGPAVADSGARV